MGGFQLDSSPNLFVLAPDTKTLWVWELKVPHSSGVEAKNWVCRHSVGSTAVQGCDYNSIILHGIEIKGSVLEELAQDLYYSHLIVNYQGFSYLDTALVGDLSFTPQYYRLNDLFNWSKFTKLDPHSIAVTITSANSNSVNFNWDRCDFRDGNLILVSVKPQIKQEESVRISELKEQNQLLMEELKKANNSSNKKDEQIAKLREQLKRCRTQVEDPAKVVKNRKRPIGGSRFEIAEEALMFPAPSLGGGDLARLETLPVYTPVDESVAGMFPRDMQVYVDKEEDFDRTGWSFIKVVNDASLNESMIAFYEGKHDSISGFGDTVRVPYKRGKPFSSSRKMFVANIQGIGKVIAFLYGDDAF